jgi:hypothetical protein
MAFGFVKKPILHKFRSCRESPFTQATGVLQYGLAIRALLDMQFDRRAAGTIEPVPELLGTEAVLRRHIGYIPATGKSSVSRTTSCLNRFRTRDFAT